MAKPDKKKRLLERANQLPLGPGCYLMKSKSEKILYVGKAKNLKSRVTSYFNNSAKSPKTEILVSHIVDFDFILTANDTEAFVLENNLIKEHTPRYNIRLRDDRSYPYITVDKNHPYPQILYQRRPKRGKGKEIYGPFVHGMKVAEVMRTVIKSFSLRDCSKREFDSRKNPCLLYQMKQCTAPCVGLISQDNYSRDLEAALDFFRGKGQKSLKVLKQRMEKAAEKEHFERAAQIRDSVFRLEEFMQHDLQENAELDFKEKDLDIIAYYVGEEEVDISVSMIRNRLLLGSKSFHFFADQTLESWNEEILVFLHQYYANTFDSLPELVVLEGEKERIEQFSQAVNVTVRTREDARKIRFQKPSKKFQSLWELTNKQSYENQRMRVEGHDSKLKALEKLQELLKLPERPQILECYDIAVWQGKSPTASQIVFEDGNPDKKRYRYYHLEERAEGNNDFAMLEEFMQRRIKHKDHPDIMIVDGGLGQVNAIKKVLEEAQVSIPIVGIAKARIKAKASLRKELEKTEERLIIPGRANPYYLSKFPPLLRLVVQMRDEAHRFSRKLHHKKEKSRIFSSWLDEVPGLGQKSLATIRRNLDVPKETIRMMDPEEIRDTLKVSLDIAKKLFSYFENAD